MTDTFEFTLSNPLTEEQLDMITDVNMERTDSVTFCTKNGKKVEFAKVRHGKWIKGTKEMLREYGYYERSDIKFCSECKHEAYWDTDYGQQLFDYCPYCGARMAEK